MRKISSDALSVWIHQGYSEAEARLLINFLNKEKRRLLKRARSTSGSAAETQNIPRHVRELLSRRKRKYRRSQNHSFPKPMLAFPFKDNIFLSGIYPNRSYNWIPVLRRSESASEARVSLQNFSFVHNPVETIQMLERVIEVEGTELQARLDFLDRECLDIGPFLVLHSVWENLAPVYSGGRMSFDIQRVIDAIGLRSSLQMKRFKHLQDHQGIWPFHLRQRRPANSSASRTRQLEPQTKEVVSDQFISKVDEWLMVVAKQRLNLSGRRLVEHMIGETLDNAERHSQPNSDDGDWAITGYLVRRIEGPDQQEVFRIHLAMLSVGSTIAESIINGPPAMLAKMNEYTNRHQGSGISVEALRTVFAMQDGVTKDINAAAAGRGGTGIQDILEFFADLVETNLPSCKAELVIVSGSSCIKVAYPHLCGVRKGQNTERELWFNFPNSPDHPPDTGHVIVLPRKLSGTLISMVIPLDPTHLEATADV